MAPNSKIDASTAVIIKHMNKLLTMNVPAAISILHGGKIHHFGSKFTKMFLKSCPELKLELEKDALVLCRGEGELTEQCRIATEDDDKATDAVVIPAPIELLNRKETITALQDLFTIIIMAKTGLPRAGNGLNMGNQIGNHPFGLTGSGTGVK